MYIHSDRKTSSDSRHSRITWDRLFNQVATLVLREVEYCIKPGGWDFFTTKRTKMSNMLYVNLDVGI